MTRWACRAIALSVLFALPVATFADIPSPPRDACRGLKEGASCEYREGYGDQGAVTAGQCMPTTCRSPGPYGQEYACLECRPLATRSESSPVAVESPTTVASEHAPNGTSAGAPNRVGISLLLGGLALGGGMLLVSRNARKRRG